MINPTKWPVVILSNYRTGSSALALKLSSDNSVPCFVEPHVNSERQAAFFSVYGKHDKYIVKFMPDQLSLFSAYKDLLESDCYLIKLQRKNIVEQIASFYLALIRDKWWTKENDVETDYFIPIKTDLIKQSCERILTTETLLNNYNSVNQTLYYEDLGIFEDIDRKHSLKPKNMNRLLDVIKNNVSR